jgi:hypothetical protein
LAIQSIGVVRIRGYLGCKLKENKMDNYCPCCGIEYATENGKVKEVDISTDHRTTAHNTKYISMRNIDLCFYCANNVAGGIIDVIYELRNDYNDYTLANYRTHPDVVEAVKRVKTENKHQSSYCPRCNEELAEKYSEYTGSNIKKCTKCNWC